tara:strand:- start:604 stop:798 length:195 start_codon:yes stop_codon:yes gene_type:complete
MTNLIIVTTCKEQQKRETGLVLDRIESFQRDGDRINVFSGGNIFSVCEDLEDVWIKLVKHFSGN